MKFYLILLCLLSLQAIAQIECINTPVKTELDRQKEIADKLTDKQCFDVESIKYMTRFSEEYCKYSIGCMNAIEDQIGNCPETKDQNTCHPPIGYLIRTQNQFPAEKPNLELQEKAVTLFQNRLKEMADLLAMIPAEKLSELSSCFNINTMFQIPEKENFDFEASSLSIKKSEIEKMQADAKQKYEKCFDQSGKITSSCNGFSQVKNGDELTQLAIQKVLINCNRVLTAADLIEMDKPSLLNIAITNKEIKDDTPAEMITVSFDDDMGANYDKFFQENAKIGHFKDREDKKRIITYFISLEAMRCQQQAKGRVKFTDLHTGDFNLKRKKLYAITENEAEKKHEQLVKPSERFNRPEKNSIYSMSPASFQDKAAIITGDMTVPSLPISQLNKNPDEIPTIPTEKSSAAQTADPVQNSNSSNYSNAYTGVDYNIPGTHPMATDQSGVPIPPPSYPSYINGAQIPQQQGQATVASSDVNAIQTKLDETQAKLDKLTAEVAATKAEAEKKKHQDEIDGLKKEIEKLKAEKASAVLTNSQPAAQIAATPQQVTAPTIAPASVRQEEYRIAVPQATVSAPSKGMIAPKSTANAPTVSGALLLRQDIIDMPSVDLTNTSSEDPAILKLAMSSVGAKAFPVQDKNKIIWTIVPLVKDGKVISYTAIREKKVADKKEKKPEIARVPASVKETPVEPAKREVFLKDLNGLIKGKN